MPIRRRMGMESSPIPGEDKLLLWDQAAFERRKDSDQEKELLKEKKPQDERTKDLRLIQGGSSCEGIEREQKDTCRIKVQRFQPFPDGA